MYRKSFGYYSNWAARHFIPNIKIIICLMLKLCLLKLCWRVSLPSQEIFNFSYHTNNNSKLVLYYKRFVFEFFCFF